MEISQCQWSVEFELSFEEVQRLILNIDIISLFKQELVLDCITSKQENNVHEMVTSDKEQKNLLKQMESEQ